MPQFCPKNCPERYPGCQSHCKGFKERKAKWEAYKAKNREIEAYERGIQTDIRVNEARKKQRLKHLYR